MITFLALPSLILLIALAITLVDDVRQCCEVQYAERCAWRAIYIYRTDPTSPDRPTLDLLFTLGIDPTATRPNVFGVLAFVSPRPWRRGDRVRAALYPYTRFRFYLPVIRWSHPMPAWKQRLYRWQQEQLHALDGRYGTKATATDVKGGR